MSSYVYQNMAYANKLSRNQFGQKRTETQRADRTATCKHCGHSQLYWRDTPSGYKLYEIGTDEKHFCEGFKREAEKKEKMLQNMQQEAQASAPSAQPAFGGLTPAKVLSAVQEEFDALIKTKELWDTEDLSNLLEKAKAHALMRFL